MNIDSLRAFTDGLRTEVAQLRHRGLWEMANVLESVANDHEQVLTDWHREPTQETGEQIMARLVHALPNLIALVSDARIAMAEALQNAENVLEAEFTIEEHEDAS